MGQGSERQRSFYHLGLIIFLLVLCSILYLGIFSKIEEVYNDSCLRLKDEEKFDCFFEKEPDKAGCEQRGCCWLPKQSQLKIPSCFYPKGYGGYHYVNVTSHSCGILAYLERSFPSQYHPNESAILRLQVFYQEKNRLRIKFEDPVHPRRESPYPILKAVEATCPTAEDRTYVVELGNESGGFLVKRRNGQILFDAVDVGSLIFARQLLQISARFSGAIFGLGEHQSTLKLSTNWTKFTLWNRDMIPIENNNLYGSHPFYLVLEPSGLSHGVFLLNSNAMDAILQPLPAVTFRIIGGILDFFIFTGPSPSMVIEEYTSLVGRPAMPPYWALGFHLCRLGYRNVSHIRRVLDRNLKSGIPVDVQWVDIDYMRNKNSFTWDDQVFSDLPEFIDELHLKGLHFVPILDPGISAGEPNGTYPPYDDGARMKLLVKNLDGSPFIGKVWNKNSTAFPDFTDKRALSYWTELIQRLHDQLPFDGLWLDMNEPSNFIDGSVKGCPENELEEPPYLPGSRGEKLYHKTICLSAVQAAGFHYDVHNLYGISESHLTYSALTKITRRRPFIISRSTFAGSGRYAGHWSGDVASTWHDMKRSVSQMLSFSIYGVPLMGSDICGFNGNTTEHLCLRWSQLGAFYPFSRNHNTDDANEQDPAAMGHEVTEAAKTALSIRYSFLPYLYTLFWFAHTRGETVARPLFFEFPEDENTRDVDTSFLWGCCLLIVPVLDDLMTTVVSYVPAGRWYDWYTYVGIEVAGANVTLPAPTNRIPILIRGGVILPTQAPASNTFLSRRSKVNLLAAYKSNLSAYGSLYWDDGSSLNVSSSMNYGFVTFTMTATNMTSHVIQWNLEEVPILGDIIILGFVQAFVVVRVNGAAWPFSWNTSNLALTLEGINLKVNEPFIITWS